MGIFDVSLTSVQPEGGTDASTSGAIAGAKDDAASAAFAQLLAELSADGPGMDPVEEIDLATAAVTPLADGLDERVTESTSEPGDEDQDESLPASGALAAFMMPVAIPDGIKDPQGTGEVARHAGAIETRPAVAGDTPDIAAAVFDTAANAEGLEIPEIYAANRTPEEANGEAGAVQGTKSAPSAHGASAQTEALASHEQEVRTIAARMAAPVEDSGGQEIAESRASETDAAPRAARVANGAPGAKTDQLSATDPRAGQSAVSAGVPDAAVDSDGPQGGQRDESFTPTNRASQPAASGSGGQPAHVVQSFQQAVAAAAHAAGAVVSVAEGAPGDGGGLDSQIVQGMQRLWRNGAEEVRVTLRPEYLGALTIALRVEQGSVTAVLHVDEPQVRAWVQTHEAQLRQALSNQGLTLERLVVTDERPGHESRERGEEARQGRRPSRRREGDDPSPIFEVAA